MQQEINGTQKDVTIEMDFAPENDSQVREIDIQQGSDEWLDLRKGVLTASKICKCFTSKGAISKAGIKTVAKILLSEHFEVDEPVLSSWAMERGNSLEVEAREMMSFIIGEEITQSGFYLNQSLNIGCSPDGMIDKNIGLEIKCPLAKKHVDNLIEGVVPPEYVAQVQFSMFVTGLTKWYFCSYYPNMKPLIVLVEKDELFHEKIQEVLDQVRLTVDQYLDQLKINLGTHGKAVDL